MQEGALGFKNQTEPVWFKWTGPVWFRI